jgi:two-component system alkaline phosphatase synthesis response regulator PhoP
MAHAHEKRILVVDDEPDVRNFLAACIEDAGFMVETAVDGMDALEKIKADMPDLVTLDMVMPRKSGIKVMRTLRENEKWASLPVIVITAHARDELGSEDIKEFNAIASGLRPRYTMEKPVTPKKLVLSICEILDVVPETDLSAGREPDSEREEIMALLKNSDEETMDRIRELLKKK